MLSGHLAQAVPPQPLHVLQDLAGSLYLTVPKLSPLLKSHWRHHKSPINSSRTGIFVFHLCSTSANFACMWCSKIFLEQKTWVLVPNFLGILTVWAAVQFFSFTKIEKCGKTLKYKGRAQWVRRLDFSPNLNLTLPLLCELAKFPKFCLGSLFAEINNFHQVTNCLCLLKSNDYVAVASTGVLYLKPLCALENYGPAKKEH